MFTEETLRFLRALKRHNDREWFRAHRERYEASVRTPSLAFVERMATVLPAFAPEAVASPRVSLYRVYRDTRFSADKSPLKTHVGMVFPWRGLPRHEGAAFYVEVAPERALVAGGLYAPQPNQLRAIRTHIAGHLKRFRRIVDRRVFRATFGGLQGDRLTRVPAGFARDHPAREFLKFRQYLVWREFAAEFAFSPRFAAEVTRHLRLMTPLVRFLHEPLVTTAGPVGFPVAFGATAGHQPSGRSAESPLAGRRRPG